MSFCYIRWRDWQQVAPASRRAAKTQHPKQLRDRVDLFSSPGNVPTCPVCVHPCHSSITDASSLFKPANLLPLLSPTSIQVRCLRLFLYLFSSLTVIPNCSSLQLRPIRVYLVKWLRLPRPSHSTSPHTRALQRHLRCPPPHRFRQPNHLSRLLVPP